MKRVRVRVLRNTPMRPRLSRLSILALSVLFVVPAFALEYTNTKKSAAKATEVSAAPGKAVANSTVTPKIVSRFRPKAKASNPFGLLTGSGFFEIGDGNITAGDGSPAGDDWLTVLRADGTAGLPSAAHPSYNGTVVPDSHLVASTGVVPDGVAPDNILTGGSTGDLEDINTNPNTTVNQKQWLWVPRSGGPDKDDIQNGFAAAYRTDPYPLSPSGDLIIYAGGDRFDNSGDAQMGFWFLQQGCNPLSDGKFHTGLTTSTPGTQHVTGDILVLADFTNGGTNPATVLITVYRWDPVGSKKLGNKFPGYPTLVQVGTGGPCGVTTPSLNRAPDPANALACGQQNLAPLPGSPPWPYKNKSGSTSYATNEFFEVGINITQLLLDAGVSQEPCISSLLIESRASQSITSVLKDFLVHNFTVAPAVTATGATSCASANLSAHVDGGQGPFTFTWTPPAGTACTQPVVHAHAPGDLSRDDILSTSCQGTWSVTATDTHGCVSPPATATLATSSITCSSTATPVSCFGASDGSLTVTFSGQNGAVTATLDGVSQGTVTSPTTFSNLATGTHTVVLTDGLSCQCTTSKLVDTPTAVSLSLTKTDVSCNGFSDGSVTATFGGGTSPYKTQIDGGGYATATSTQTFMNLKAGSHTVDMKDANGCMISKSIMVTEPTAVTLSLTKTDVSCFGVSDGTVTATFGGGTSPYQTQIDNGGYNAATSPQTFMGLAAGSHTVDMKDANGCTISKSITVGTPPLVSLTAIGKVGDQSGTFATLTATESGADTAVWKFYDDSGVHTDCSNNTTGTLALSPTVGPSNAPTFDTMSGLLTLVVDSVNDIQKYGRKIDLCNVVIKDPVTGNNVYYNGQQWDLRVNLTVSQGGNCSVSKEITVSYVVLVDPSNRKHKNIK